MYFKFFFVKITHRPVSISFSQKGEINHSCALKALRYVKNVAIYHQLAM